MLMLDRINTAEYYPIGHDTPESLFDAKLCSSPRSTVSFLFGGIGDARNLFQTLVHIATQDRKTNKQNGRKFYHFTIVDIKSSAIARDLVILLLLDELSELVDNTDKAIGSNTLLCLVYTFFSSIMPASLHNLLQEKIAQAKNALEEDTLPSYIEIPSMYRAETLRYLDDWQCKVQQEYPITRMQPQILQARAQEEHQHMAFGGPAEFMNLPAGVNLAKEQRFEALTGAIMLPSPQNNILGPDLQKAFKAFDARAPRPTVKGALSAIRSSWATNVTLVDLYWERSRDPDPFMDIDVGDCPFTWCHKAMEAGVKTPKAKSFFDYAAPWFISIAQALRQLHGQIRIEACVGDVTAVLEQIRYGVVGHRRQATPSEVPADTLQAQAQDMYPQMYDRIHLSNVPDYIGGTLTSYMYALQLTHPGQHSYITSTCLRNPPRFSTVEAFDAEYVALYTKKDLEKVFHVRMKPNDEIFMPMCVYNRWHHLDVSRKYADLVPRTKLEDWLFRLFFKVAIPPTRRMIVDNELIYSPLNLSFFFRLCTHLHSIGYPAHWLSDVLSTILSGSITTSARPPRSEPLKPREIDTARKAMTQSVAPFKSEFSTLAAMWQLILPFGILSNNIAPIGSIKQYSASFKNISKEVIAYPNFVLVFYKGHLPPKAMYDLRSTLLSDEKGNEDYKLFREKRINIVSTWSWHRRSRTATFWLREDVVQKMRKEDWQVCIYRTDNWTPQSNAYDFSYSTLRECGTSWAQRVNKESPTIRDANVSAETVESEGDWSDTDSLEESDTGSGSYDSNSDDFNSW